MIIKAEATLNMLVINKVLLNIIKQTGGKSWNEDTVVVEDQWRN